MVHNVGSNDDSKVVNGCNREKGCADIGRNVGNGSGRGDDDGNSVINVPDGDDNDGINGGSSVGNSRFGDDDHGDSVGSSVGNVRDVDDTEGCNDGSSVGNGCYGYDADGDSDGSNAGNSCDNNEAHGDSDGGQVVIVMIVVKNFFLIAKMVMNDADFEDDENCDSDT